MENKLNFADKKLRKLSQKFETFLTGRFSKCFSAIFPVLHREMKHAQQPIRSNVLLHICY